MDQWGNMIGNPIAKFLVMIVGSAVPYSSTAFAQNTTSKTLANATSNTNTTGATANKTALLKPGNTALNTAALDVRMLQLTYPNKPKDIATLAYIWGYPLVTVAGSYAYYTTKGVPNLGEGPVDTICELDDIGGVPNFISSALIIP